LLGFSISSFKPITFVKIDISPPNKSVVIKTTTSVELTIRLLFGEREGRIWMLKAKAMAPLMLPLNHIRSNYLNEILMSKYRHILQKERAQKLPRLEQIYMKRALLIKT
jgi:hypothetical protein